MNTGDTAWVLMSSSLVMLMTPAIGLFYGGMVERKNLLSTIMLSFGTLLIVTMQWVLFGYSLSFGTDWRSLIGDLGWCGLANIGVSSTTPYAPTIPHLAYMLFQMKFAIITPALISGAFVERVRFKTFMVFTLLWTTLIYDPVAHWVWGDGGWLKKMGSLDFAGGTVVHITAGVAALALCIALRRKKRAVDGRFQPESVPLTLFGAVLLWFGWFGFNGGSALGANASAAQALVTTTVAAAAAALTWMLVSSTEGKNTAVGAATGAVVGLVAITPACGYVDLTAAIVIGAVGAVVAFFSIKLSEKLKIQDSLDVCACHGMAGTWGALATGIFASKAINPAGADGLIHGNGSLLLAQFASVVAVWIFTFVGTYVLAKLLDRVMHFTASTSEQEVGLDAFHYGEESVERPLSGAVVT
ncbi:MAG: ammonium transporter [Cyanobacteria bacterium SZAS LIN-3]|nr:ammonium transporter [Cyanobacteria bacterium SZAS LIN-3]